MNNNQLRVVLLQNDQLLNQQHDQMQIQNRSPYQRLTNYNFNCLIIFGLTLLILILCIVFAIGFCWILFRKLPF